MNLNKLSEMSEDELALVITAATEEMKKKKNKPLLKTIDKFLKTKSGFKRTRVKINGTNQTGTILTELGIDVYEIHVDNQLPGSMMPFHKSCFEEIEEDDLTIGQKVKIKFGQEFVNGEIEKLPGRYGNNYLVKAKMLDNKPALLLRPRNEIELYES